MRLLIDERLDAYCTAHTTEPSQALRELTDYTRAHVPSPQMQVGRVEGRLLATLVGMMNAKRVLEVGTYTGYSALAMAEALAEDARVVTCDIDPVNTEVARKAWAGSPHGSKIELRLGDARATIAAMPAEPTFDFVFIDADKGGYVDYYELALPRLREGGVIAADNTLWSGAVLDPKTADDHAIVRFNAHVAADPRVTSVLLPVRDGLMLARKQGSRGEAAEGARASGG